MTQDRRDPRHSPARPCIVDGRHEECFRGVVIRDILYDDGRVLLDQEGVTLRHYYFPFGTSKRIPYRRIQRVSARPMGWWTGRGRAWGTGHPGYWLPLDLTRPRKSSLIVVELGRAVKPAFSPDDPERVLQLLRERIRA